MRSRLLQRVPSIFEMAATRLQDKFENAVDFDKELKNLAIQGIEKYSNNIF